MLATELQGLLWPAGTPVSIGPTDRNKLMAQLRVEGPCGRFSKGSSQTVSEAAGQMTG